MHFPALIKLTRQHFFLFQSWIITMLNGDSPFHFKPLSVYSHLVCSKQQCNTNSPVYNIQVHISNNVSRAKKRRLDDSCLDEICETPLKRQRITRTCSQDLGYCSFLSGSQGSTPIQPLTVTKDVTPPRSKVNQSVTPVVSTPLSKYKQNHIGLDRDRESLPSPIPVLKWDREVSSDEIKLCAFLNFNACSSVAFVGSQGTGKGEIREVSQNDFISLHESKSQSAPPESVVPLKEEEELLSVSQQAEPEASDRDRNEESASDTFESTLPLQVQVWAPSFIHL